MSVRSRKKENHLGWNTLGIFVGNGEQLIINHFHEWVKTCLKDGTHVENELQRLFQLHPACIIMAEMKLGMELFR